MATVTNSASATPGDETKRFFVAPSGSDEAVGDQSRPFATLGRARDAVRAFKSANGIPGGGIEVGIGGGVYPLYSPLELSEADSGEAGKPIIWRAVAGESVRLTGAHLLPASAFRPLAEADAEWARLEAGVREKCYLADLTALGITNYGTLKIRGFGTAATSALELFLNGERMQLARWPDVNENTPKASATNDVISIFGDLSPNVAGEYRKVGENDGVSVFKRTGLVDGLQFWLYRWRWEYEGRQHLAWFLTTNESGYPAQNTLFWHRYDSELGTMTASAPAAGDATFLDGEAIDHGFVRVAEVPAERTIRYFGDRPSRWGQPEHGWLHGYWIYTWAETHLPIASLDIETRTLLLGGQPDFGLAANQPYYAYNLLEEITVPGEWFLDRQSGRLVFYSPVPPASAEISVTIADGPLVALNNASFVEFRDISIEQTRGRLVEISGGSSNRLAGVSLSGSGGTAVDIGGTGNGITMSTIRDVGGGGVSLHGGDRSALANAGNYVERTRIHDFSKWEWTYRPAVLVAGCGQRVASNLIYDAPHTAVLYTGNEHCIELNEIHNVNRFSSDAGAIYGGRDWGGRGVVIRHNYLHDLQTSFDGHGVHAIYLDDCLSGIRVEGNLVVDVSHYGLLNGGGRDNIMMDNVFVRCGAALLADARGFEWTPRGPSRVPGDSWNLVEKLIQVGYRSSIWTARYPECAVIPDNYDQIYQPGTMFPSEEGKHWLFPEGSVFSRNLGSQLKQPVIESHENPIGWYREWGTNLLELAESPFVDEANGNLEIKPGVSALIPGFKPPPFSQIGLR